MAQIDEGQANSVLAFQYRGLEQRNTLIDKLMKELDKRAEALQVVGQELVKLREFKAGLEQKVKVLSAQVQQDDQHFAAVSSDLLLLPREDLCRRYHQLHQKLQRDCDIRKKLEEEVERTHRQISQRNEMEKRLIEVRQAHTAQSLYIQELQTKLESTSKVTRRQEEVIVKLEEQNAQLRQRVLELEKEDKVMQTTIEASPPKDVANLALLMRTERAERRVIALEEELRQLARAKLGFPKKT